MIKHLSSAHVVDLISLTTSKEKEYIPRISELCRNIVPVNIDHYVNKGKRDHFKLDNLDRSFFRLWRLIKGVPFEFSGFYFLEMRQKLVEMLSVNRYDIVQVEHSAMGQYFNDINDAKYNSQKILDDLDLSFTPLLRMYKNEKKLFLKLMRYIGYRINKTYAVNVWKLFDKIVVMSEIDKIKALSICPELSIHVVPNGVDLSYFRPLSRKGTTCKLLLIGGTQHSPNVDAFFYFYEKIFPRVKELLKNITVTVIGTGWDSISNRLAHEKGLEFTGFVDDIRPYFSGQTILMAPIRIGGGTRLKILEAMALGVPVVSTSVGCEGIPVEEGRHVLVADTPEDFARKIKVIFTDNRVCSTLIDNAQDLVRENYGWDKLALTMENIYNESERTKPEASPA